MKRALPLVLALWAAGCDDETAGTEVVDGAARSDSGADGQPPGDAGRDLGADSGPDLDRKSVV
jgi:hypothetical protein